VPVERNVVLLSEGSCSFCGKALAAARRLLGAVSSTARICDSCVALCGDIIAGAAIKTSGDEEKPRSRIAELLRELASVRDESTRQSLLEQLEQIRRTLPPPQSFDPSRCSFCKAHRDQVAKLVNGPRVFICDRCVGEARDVLSS
jgi:ATP-dependent protease Clp ATPase subunit